MSCNSEKKDSSKHLNLVTVENQETAIKTEIKKDTLFSDFYDKMPFKELRQKQQQYYFMVGNDSINFEINYRLSNGKLDTLFLVKEGVFNQKDFNYILNLYRAKYGNCNVSKKIVNVLYRENYKIKHIYWNNEDKSDFFYLKDKDILNGIYRNGVEDSYLNLDMNSYNNSSKLSTYGYHIFAVNKQTNENWVFEVDVKKLKDEFVKYELRSYLFKDGAKIIELQTFKLFNKGYRKKREETTGDDLMAAFIPPKINSAKDLPHDYMKIKYYINRVDKTNQKRKINVDSLKKEQLRKNKNDI